MRPSVDVMIIDSIEEYYTLIRNREDYFIPNPKGYYYKNNPIPALFMDGSQKYYTISGYSLFHNPINTLDGISNEEVVNSVGGIVLDLFKVNNKDRLLKTNSDYMYNAVMFIYEYVTHTVNSICPYITYDEPNKYVSRLSEKGYLEYSNGSFNPDIVLKRLAEQLDLFIGEDIWFIYDIRISGRNITIEKTVDYRIMDWERIKEEEKMKTLEEDERKRNV